MSLSLYLGPPLDDADGDDDDDADDVDDDDLQVEQSGFNPSLPWSCLCLRSLSCFVEEAPP